MSENVSGRNDQGTFSAAQEAVGSAATSSYEAGAKAARYVSDTTSEHPFPVLAGVAIAAFLAGILSASGGSDKRRDWHDARNWRDRSREMANRARSSAPDVSRVANDAGEYAYRTVSENPFSSALAAAAVVGLIGYLSGRR